MIHNNTPAGTCIHINRVHRKIPLNLIVKTWAIFFCFVCILNTRFTIIHLVSLFTEQYCTDP